MANQDDNNNQEIEKVEDVEVETTKNTSDTDNKKQNNDPVNMDFTTLKNVVNKAKEILK